MEKTIENENYILNIFTDEDPIDSREFDVLGSMVCFHKKYKLGDEHNFNSKCFDSLDKLQKYLYDWEKALTVIPVYLYDHSGLSVNTTGFSCKWDSGQVGFIYVTKARVRKEFNVLRISKKLKMNVEQILLSEVDLYNDYLNGSVYGFSLVEKKSNEELLTCSNFYGKDMVDNGIYYYVKDFFCESQLKEVLL